MSCSTRMAENGQLLVREKGSEKLLQIYKELIGE